MGKFNDTLNNQEWLNDHYHNQKMSPQEIAELVGSSYTNVMFYLKKHQIPLKTASEAQKQCLDRERKPHPTKGKPRDPETKKKLSKKAIELWDGLSQKERQKRINLVKQQWERMSPEDKKRFQRAGLEGVRKAAKTGSKLERFIANALLDNKISIERHKSGLIPNQELEIDIFLPEHGIALEIDGPSHLRALWGEEKFLKIRQADIEKNGLIISAGLSIIRIKYDGKYIRKKRYTTLVEDLLQIVASIKPAEIRELIV